MVLVEPTATHYLHFENCMIVLLFRSRTLVLEFILLVWYSMLVIEGSGKEKNVSAYGWGWGGWGGWRCAPHLWDRQGMHTFPTALSQVPFSVPPPIELVCFDTDGSQSHTSPGPRLRQVLLGVFTLLPVGDLHQLRPDPPVFPLCLPSHLPLPHFPPLSSYS